jgi:hypothetical protein
MDGKKREEGSWALCAGGQYVELHLINNLAISCTNVKPDGSIQEYRVKGDSMFINDPGSKEIISLFYEASDSTLTLTPADASQLVFNRITESTDAFFNKSNGQVTISESYKEGYMNRQAASSCMQPMNP